MEKFESEAVDALCKLNIDEINELRIKWQQAINEQDPELYIRTKEYTDAICNVAISRIKRKEGAAV